MTFIPRRFIGFPQVTLREKREIFDAPPEAPPTITNPPEGETPDVDPDNPQKTAGGKIEDADAAFQRRAAQLDQVEQSIKKLAEAAGTADVADPNSLDANFNETDTALKDMESETQGVAIPPELQQHDLATLLKMSAQLDNGASASKAMSLLQSVEDAKTALKDNPHAKDRLQDLQDRTVQLLKQHLALQLAPQQKSERSKKAIEKNVNKAKEIAGRVDLTNMTEKQKNRQIAQLMMNYGVEVVQNGNKLDVIAPGDSFSSLMNRLYGIYMLITGFAEKETGKKAVEQSASAPPDKDQNGGQEKNEKQPDSELMKEIREKGVRVVRGDAQREVNSLTSDLDGSASKTGLRDQKADAERTRAGKQQDVDRLNHELTLIPETDTAGKNAKKAEIETAKADLTTAEEAVKTIDAKIKEAETRQKELQSKINEIDSLKDATDKEAKELGDQMNTMKNDLDKAPLKDNADAKKIFEMLGAATVDPHATDKLHITFTVADASTSKWTEGIDTAVKFGVDRSAFETETVDGGSVLKNPADCRKALTQIMEKMSADTQALDKGVKAFTDKGVDDIDTAKLAVQLNADYPNLKLDFKDKKFFIPESSDIEACHAFVRSHASLKSSPLKQVFADHINNAMRDITSDRGGKMLKSYLTEIYTSGPWADPVLHNQLIELQKSGVPVLFEVRTDSSGKAHVSAEINKAKAKESALYKATEPGKTIVPALKTFIDS